MDIVDEHNYDEVEFVTPREYVKHMWHDDPIAYSKFYDDICGTNLSKLVNDMFVAKNNGEYLAILMGEVNKIFRNLPDEAIERILKTPYDGDDDGFNL